jgi:hypothetical protein
LASLDISGATVATPPAEKREVKLPRAGSLRDRTGSIRDGVANASPRKASASTPSPSNRRSSGAKKTGRKSSSTKTTPTNAGRDERGSVDFALPSDPLASFGDEYRDIPGESDEMFFANDVEVDNLSPAASPQQQSRHKPTPPKEAAKKKKEAGSPSPALSAAEL